MNWFFYAVALPVALLLFASAACALHWALKHGQTRALWDSVRSLVGLLPSNEGPGAARDGRNPETPGASQQT